MNLKNKTALHRHTTPFRVIIAGFLLLILAGTLLLMLPVSSAERKATWPSWPDTYLS